MGAAANLDLIDLRCHSGDYVKNIVIRNVVGVNFAAGTQLSIYLNASATDVRLTMENVHLTTTADAPCDIVIGNPDRIVGGSIRNVTGNFTAGSRPALCNPLYYQKALDLSAVASGGNTNIVPTGLVGLAKGDIVTVVPRTNDRVGITGLYPYWGAESIAVNIANNSGGNLSATETFDI